MHGSAPWKTEETIVGLPRLPVLSVFSRSDSPDLVAVTFQPQTSDLILQIWWLSPFNLPDQIWWLSPFNLLDHPDIELLEPDLERLNQVGQAF
jgi:hypothetical protein